MIPDEPPTPRPPPPPLVVLLEEAMPVLVVWKGVGPTPCNPYGLPYMGKPVIFMGGWKGR